MKKLLIVTMVIVMILVFLVGCNSSNQTDPMSKSFVTPYEGMTWAEHYGTELQKYNNYKDFEFKAHFKTLTYGADENCKNYFEFLFEDYSVLRVKAIDNKPISWEYKKRVIDNNWTIGKSFNGENITLTKSLPTPKRSITIAEEWGKKLKNYTNYEDFEYDAKSAFLSGSGDGGMLFEDYSVLYINSENKPMAWKYKKYVMDKETVNGN